MSDARLLVGPIAVERAPSSALLIEEMGINNNRHVISVSEVVLKKHFSFMYENFVFSSQHRLFLILEKIGEQIEALQFDFVAYKYGHPNDELSHPLSQYGLGHYGLFKVDNSPWIAEILNSNRQHPRHSDHIFGGCEHYIARFKDVTLEVICNRIEQIQITREYFLKLVETEIGFVENDDRQE